MRRYSLDHPALWNIARIIHEADLEDDRYDAPEARGLDVLLRGLSMICTDEETLQMTERLYEHQRRATMLSSERP